MEELFDIYDEELRPLGSAPRSEVHAKGYWHQTFHCWLVRRGPSGGLLVQFQKRQSGKDTFPDCYDITVAGHLSSGETVRDAVREIQEEIGLSPVFEELVLLDTIREEAEGVVNGVPFIDREVSHVFGWLTDAEITQYVLQESEVAGIYEASLDDLLALFDGRRSEVEARGWELAGGKLPRGYVVTADQFVERDPAVYSSVFRKLEEAYSKPAR